MRWLVKTSTSASTLAIGAGVRYRVSKNDKKTDASILAGLRYDSTSVDTPESSTTVNGEDQSNPNAEDPENTSGTSALTIYYGLGLEHFLGNYWSASVDATNPLFLRTGTESYNGTSDNNTSQTASSSGFFIGWDPSIRIQLHLYI